ncbi:MAG TPA: iron-containing alcohol dehydrogenase [Candidatus Lokiarchaeia archaeon]|nr:iron-containing alcohol dehydrogenase [Candidatus Lokiarchaeia archaeon]
MELKEKARELLQEFKGNNYVFGIHVLDQIAPLIENLGSKRAAIVVGSSPASQQCLEAFQSAASNTGAEIIAVVDGAGSNAPREDVMRIAGELKAFKYDTLVAIGGGSNIDAAKCAETIKVTGASFDDLFGIGQVTALLEKKRKKLAKVFAIQTAASSSAHLTKYSNITDVSTGQKKVIIDMALVPQKAAFDYSLTVAMTPEYTADGALDGIGHSLEVLYGSIKQDYYKKVKEIAACGIELIVSSLEKVVIDPSDLDAREAIGLGTDLGGYAIMTGGTNGGHLTSFSLVGVMSHGRAVGLMNPYYTVLFANSIREPLEILFDILGRFGYVSACGCEDFDNRDLSIEVAKGLQLLSQAVGFPTKLDDVAGFMEKDYIAQALEAAKDPALKSKLENMPSPLSLDMVDEYLGSVLTGAKTGDLSLVQTL